MSEKLTGEALQDRARELDIEGRSGMSADELRAAIAEAEGAEESDASEDEVLSNEESAELSGEGAVAAEELSEADLELAEPEMDFAGPLHLQSPSERVETGAMSEEQAEEQAARGEERGDTVGETLESGEAASPEVEEQDFEEMNEERDELHQEVVDYPEAHADSGFNPDGIKRAFRQKAQIDTTGLSQGPDPDGNDPASLEHGYVVEELREGPGEQRLEEQLSGEEDE